MNKKIILLSLIAILLIFSAATIWYTFQAPYSSKPFIHYENEVVATFLEKRTEKNHSYLQSSGKFFCSAITVWEQSISSDEKIVYNDAQCQSVVLKDGDLRGEGGGTEPPLYKLKKTNSVWTVIDSDDRGISPSQPSTKDWVNKYYRLVPNYLKTGGRSGYAVTEGLIKKAARYYGVSVPNYTYASCSSTASCQDNEACVKHGDHSNPGPNACIKRCNANNECGVAHTCLKQCVNGENGCPDTAQTICVPDLLHVSLEKTPEKIIQ